MIKNVFKKAKGTYGYRRITEGLKIEYGVIFNHKKVARIMKKYYLKPEYVKRTKPNIYKRVEENVQPNILKRDFKADKLNQKWTTDITYLILQNKRLYLSTILDLYDRKVVSYKISKFNNNQLVIDTLNVQYPKEKMYMDLSFTVIKDSNIHLSNTNPFVNLTELLFQCPEKVLQ